MKQKNMSKFKAFIMNVIDIRYWFCECAYYSPYGLVISADMCKKHDRKKLNNYVEQLRRRE